MPSQSSCFQRFDEIIAAAGSRRQLAGTRPPVRSSGSQPQYGSSSAREPAAWWSATSRSLVVMIGSAGGPGWMRMYHGCSAHFAGS